MKQTLTYQEGVEKLEAIVQSMEQGDLNIDELSEKIKTATRLLQHCKEALHHIEEQLKIDD
ncbi:MAG: exodeoxyribonuclease VII small subunit [Prevotellaceae bacterium]|jgi:exodeoxyribonuclease VII small subunit|nr:exodeoxyribonuclease VII small subunit [Prevotellaceae bacterium]